MSERRLGNQRRVERRCNRCGDSVWFTVWGDEPSKVAADMMVVWCQPCSIAAEAESITAEAAEEER